MLIIHCPFCGPRSENEFTHGGPARVPRPENSAEFGNQEWVDYLTHQPNPVGVVSEKWWHVRGCGAWITVQRDTVTHTITNHAGAQTDSRIDTGDGAQHNSTAS